MRCLGKYKLELWSVGQKATGQKAKANLLRGWTALMQRGTRESYEI
jgi:hypothetical protein